MKYKVELYATDELGRTVTYSTGDLELPTEIGKMHYITTSRTQDSDSEGDPDSLSIRAKVEITAVP